MLSNAVHCTFFRRPVLITHPPCTYHYFSLPVILTTSANSTRGHFANRQELFHKSAFCQVHCAELSFPISVLLYINIQTLSDNIRWKEADTPKAEPGCCIMTEPT